MGRLLPDRRPDAAGLWGAISSQARSIAVAREIPRELRLAVRALEDHKGQDILVLDLRKVSDATDFFLIVSGTSDTHVRTLAERVLEAIREEGGHPHHVEGLTAGRWALLDFVDMVVHVFHPTLRAYYQLERLWADAPALTAQDLGELLPAGPVAPATRTTGPAQRRRKT